MCIIGKSFTIAEKKGSVTNHRKVTILREINQDGLRVYEVAECGRKNFTALADAYDRFLNVQPGKILSKNYRGTLSPKQLPAVGKK